MKNFTKATIAFLFAALILSTGCRKFNEIKKDLRDFTQVNLVDNNGEYSAAHMDTTLKNAWGLAFSSNGIAWVNSNGGGVSEVYTAEGVILRPPVNIPTPTDSIGGNPTGIVFSGGKGFKLSNGAGASFLFVTEDGILAGWNGAAGNNAIRIKDLSATSSFKGLAISSWGANNYIYASDFKGNKIIVWDTMFNMISMPFQDPGIPAGFAPFNIQAVGSWLYVTYAKVGPDGDDVKGPGNGFVSIFKPDGSFVSRFASRGALNSPWGIAAAGSGFLDAGDMDNEDEDQGAGKNNSSGKHLGMDDHHDLDSVILVGNFGDGRINVFSMNGLFVGQLQSHKHTIVIDGLWALSFPPASATSVDPGRLYFTAGPDDEADGLFGYLIKK